MANDEPEDDPNDTRPAWQKRIDEADGIKRTANGTPINNFGCVPCVWEPCVWETRRRDAHARSQLTLAAHARSSHAQLTRCGFDSLCFRPPPASR